MLGTLNGALEVRGITLDPPAIRADVRGINEVREGLPVLTRVEIAYTLEFRASQRDVVERALAKHQAKCPTAATLAGAVDIRWTAELIELDDT